MSSNLYKNVSPRASLVTARGLPEEPIMKKAAVQHQRTTQEFIIAPSMRARRRVPRLWAKTENSLLARFQVKYSPLSSKKPLSKKQTMKLVARNFVTGSCHQSAKLRENFPRS